MKFNKLIPELTVSDIERSKLFYTEVLGFRIEYERVEDKFAFLSLGEAQMMIEEENGHWDTGVMEYPFGRGINFQIDIEQLDQFVSHVKEKGIELFQDVFTSHYQCGDVCYEEKEVLILDPDGYLLRFSETQQSNRSRKETGIREIGITEIEEVKRLFLSVFTIEPWNDDWSDPNQLHLYLMDLMGQSNSLTYGLFEEGNLIAVSMGYIKHWYSGTEYCIDELFVKTEKQSSGIGTFFIREIEKQIKELGLEHIFLQTESDVPAYEFYKKNGFWELKNHVSFVKKISH